MAFGHLFKLLLELFVFDISDNLEAIDDIIPSLEGLLDQLHNIKPHQFYENQRKLKLYELRLLEEELEAKKNDLFKGVDQIINWLVTLKNLKY